MSESIQQSIVEVAQAINNLNRAFERHAENLQREKDTDQLQKWTFAARAMQDSGNIYLTWARHYAGSTASEQDEDPFLDEGIDSTN